jgi:hypothetical protein
MNRVFHKYDDWEDYINGMYNTEKDSEYFVDKSIILLKDNNMFLKEGLNMIEKWVISADENLSNTNCNRLSWIGQATCCFLFGSPEKSTRKAWSLLSSDERNNANVVATKILKQYERKNRKIYKSMGEKLLF